MKKLEKLESSFNVKTNLYNDYAVSAGIHKISTFSKEFFN